jgi:pantoate--beta-alanine ligase
LRLWVTGEKNAAFIRQSMMELIHTKPLADIEYISIANAETLEELEALKPPVLISMVVRFGKTRLLDNIILE